jgi:hypothetical protein
MTVGSRRDGMSVTAQSMPCFARPLYQLSGMVYIVRAIAGPPRAAAGSLTPVRYMPDFAQPSSTCGPSLIPIYMVQTVHKSARAAAGPPSTAARCPTPVRDCQVYARLCTALQYLRTVSDTYLHLSNRSQKRSGRCRATAGRCGPPPTTAGCLSGPTSGITQKTPEKMVSILTHYILLIIQLKKQRIAKIYQININI